VQLTAIFSEPFEFLNHQFIIYISSQQVQKVSSYIQQYYMDISYPLHTLCASYYPCIHMSKLLLMLDTLSLSYIERY